MKLLQSTFSTTVSCCSILTTTSFDNRIRLQLFFEKLDGIASTDFNIYLFRRFSESHFWYFLRGKLHCSMRYFSCRVFKEFSIFKYGVRTYDGRMCLVHRTAHGALVAAEEHHSNLRTTTQANQYSSKRELGYEARRGITPDTLGKTYFKKVSVLP